MGLESWATAGCEGVARRLAGFRKRVPHSLSPVLRRRGSLQEQDLYDSVEPWRALRSVGSIGFQVSDTQLNSVLCADEGRE